MRLDKMVADSAAVTRSRARKKIKSGAVEVNGAVVRDISAQVSEKDALTVSGENLQYKKYIYLMLNKPQGVLSATEDKRQKTVMELIPGEYKRYSLFPVGRLDIDTTGFLLLTNDGETAHKILSPNKKVGKTYIVTAKLPVTENMLCALREGVDIGGVITKKADARLLSPDTVRLTIYEGKFHQIKRMFHAVGNEVIALKRIAYGNVFLDAALKEGKYRPLTDEELEKLV